MDLRISHQVDRGQLAKGLDFIGQLMRLSLIKAGEAGQTKLPGTSQEPFTFKQPGGVRLTTRPSSPTRPVASGPQLKLPGYEPHQPTLPQTEKITPKVLPEPAAPEKREHEAGPVLIGGGRSRQADWGGLETAAKRAQAVGPKMEARPSGLVVPSHEISDPKGESPYWRPKPVSPFESPEQPKSPEIIKPAPVGAGGWSTTRSAGPEPTGEVISQPKPEAEIITPPAPTPTMERGPGTAGRQREAMKEGAAAVREMAPGPERTAAMKRAGAFLGSRTRERAAEVPAPQTRPAAPQSAWVPGKEKLEIPSQPQVVAPGEAGGEAGGGKESPSGGVGLPPSGWDPFKKLSQRSKRRGPNLIGGYGFGHAMGASAATPAGGAAQLGMLTGRAVATAHGLLNRPTSRYGSRYEMARLGREGELTRRAQLGRMQGESGGVMTQGQGSMYRSLFVGINEELDLVKSRVRPKRSKSRLFVSIYSNPSLFGRGKKEEDKEPTVQLPSLMPKTPKPRTVTLFGKAKDKPVPDPQNEDIQPDEEDGVASVLVGDGDLVSKAGAAQESTGRWTLEDPVQTKREYEHGFERQPIGVSGGQTPDLPERGRDWHGTVPGVPDEPQDDDEEPAEETWGAPKPILESEKKKKKKRPEVVSKALVPYQYAQQQARDILKALPELQIGPDLTSREREFLKSQGWDDEDIFRGRFRVTPRMQTEFRRFMTDRVFKSLSGLRQL